VSKPKIRHLAIVSLDPEKLAKFYCDVFDMEVLGRTKNGGVFVSDGYMTVALLNNRAEGKPSGLNHFGFHIEDADEISEKLTDFGMRTPAERPPGRPYAETRATDPDGNNFDLSVHGFQEAETSEDRGKAKGAEPKIEKVEG
jgi:catechol 2,3-dioxygenase-like lactoylglutathione lyase family enzyme